MKIQTELILPLNVAGLYTKIYCDGAKQTCVPFDLCTARNSHEQQCLFFYFAVYKVRMCATQTR